MLNENIKELCSEKGISQRELQRVLNLSSGSISKWKTTSPTLKHVEDIAKYFNVSIDYLVGNTKFRTQEEMLEHFNHVYLPLK